MSLADAIGLRCCRTAEGGLRCHVSMLSEALPSVGPGLFSLIARAVVEEAVGGESDIEVVRCTTRVVRREHRTDLEVVARRLTSAAYTDTWIVEFRDTADRTLSRAEVLVTAR